MSRRVITTITHGKRWIIKIDLQGEAIIQDAEAKSPERKEQLINLCGE
jgi:hypothetical protein